MSSSDTLALVAVIVSLISFGGAFVIFIRGFQSGEAPMQVIESGVDFLDDMIRDSAVHQYIDQQVKAGNLDPRLANMVDVILGVARSTSPETASTARQKIAQLLDDMTDGDLET